MKLSKQRFSHESEKNRGVISKIPDLFKMYKASINGKYKMKTSSFLIPLVGVIYFILPIDLGDLFPPLMIPIIGYADDVALLFFGLKYVMKDVDNFNLKS